MKLQLEGGFHTKLPTHCLPYSHSLSLYQSIMHVYMYYYRYIDIQYISIRFLAHTIILLLSGTHYTAAYMLTCIILRKLLESMGALPCTDVPTDIYATAVNNDINLLS